MKAQNASGRETTGGLGIGPAADLTGRPASDGRIDASAYDKRAGEIRQQQDQVQRRMSERQADKLPPINQAVDVMALASKAANLFVEQPGAKGGELRRCFRKPFSELSVSNRATRTNDDCLQLVKGDAGNWR
jgi:hypothetical protein